MRSSNKSVLVVFPLLLALSLTACGTRTGAPAAEAPQQKGPIRVGASISLTGRYDRTGRELKNGYDLGAEQTNAAGGVLGRQVEFVTYDDTSDPETARN